MNGVPSTANNVASVARLRGAAGADARSSSGSPAVARRKKGAGGKLIPRPGSKLPLNAGRRLPGGAVAVAICIAAGESADLAEEEDKVMQDGAGAGTGSAPANSRGSAA